MSMQRSSSLSLAGAVALALFGVAATTTAQTTAPQPATQQQVPPSPPPPTTTIPAQPAQPMPAPPPPAQPAAQDQPQAVQQQGATGFYPGTKSSATYPIQNGTLTVNAGMPDRVQNFGPPPAFESLDSNHDGRISESEAQAYPPLDSDFLYASGGGQSISRAQYGKWTQTQQ